MTTKELAERILDNIGHSDSMMDIERVLDINKRNKDRISALIEAHITAREAALVERIEELLELDDTCTWVERFIDVRELREAARRKE